MNLPTSTAARVPRHRGPHLGILAVAFMALKLASLYPVSALAGGPSFAFPGPGAPAASIPAYFQAHGGAVLLSSLLQYGSAIPLGIFTAASVSRLRFLGVRAAGVEIAMLGGFLATFDSIASASIIWALGHGGVASDAALARALFYTQFAFGGPGYGVPLGLLLAGLSLPAAFVKALPRWLVVSGLVLAAVGVLSWFSLAFVGATVLIPLIRFPGFIWLIAVGFSLPASPIRLGAARPAP